MNLFDVYPLFDINIVKGKGCHVWDEKGTEYLDLYGGHAVISIGHAHPHYVEMISNLSPCFSRCSRHLLVFTTCFRSMFFSTMCTKESFA